MELLRELLTRREKSWPVTYYSNNGIIAVLFFCAILPTAALSETLVGYIDDGTRFEARDELCRTTPYGMPKNSYIFRILSGGVSVTDYGCWQWADESKNLHIKLWSGREFFIPASAFMSSDEAERSHAQRIKEKKEREYIESIYKKAELAKAEAKAEEMSKIEAAKPKTWISFSKYGLVVLTQTQCSSKEGSVAHVIKPGHEMNTGCWQYRDANIVVTVDGREYMYTIKEFTQQ
jgi:hypothetical protein